MADQLPPGTRIPVGTVVFILVLAFACCWGGFSLFGGQLRHAVGGEVLPGDRDQLDAGR
jgi:hypothetical protein